MGKMPRISPRPGPGREKPDRTRPSGGRASGAATGYSPRATPRRVGTVLAVHFSACPMAKFDYDYDNDSDNEIELDPDPRVE